MSLKSGLTNVVVVLLLAHGWSASAASFDCAKANTFIEHAVCNDPSLSLLDEQLAQAYRAALARTSDQSALKASQRSWLRMERNICKDTDCLRTAYSTRLTQLHREGASMSVSSYGPITGMYRRISGDANIDLIDRGSGRVSVVGNAVWVGNAEMGQVNMGQIDGVILVRSGKAEYIDPEYPDCRVMIHFGDAVLEVEDAGGCGGLNVTFSGRYARTHHHVVTELSELDQPGGVGCAVTDEHDRVLLWDRIMLNGDLLNLPAPMLTSTTKTWNTGSTQIQFISTSGPLLETPDRFSVGQGPTGRLVVTTMGASSAFDASEACFGEP